MGGIHYKEVTGEMYIFARDLKRKKKIQKDRTVKTWQSIGNTAGNNGRK